MVKIVPLDRRRQARAVFGRRRIARPISPQETISEFEQADRQMRALMRSFNVLKAALGISDASEQSLARHRALFERNKHKRLLLDELAGLKTSYLAALKKSAWFRRMIKLRLLRDPKFVQIENLAAFTHRVFGIIRECEKSGKHYSMAILDIDSFKQINDNFGHGTGDIVINELASLLSDFATKHHGASARVGGEEFRVFVPMTKAELARHLLSLKTSFKKSLRDPSRFGAGPSGKKKDWFEWQTPSFSAGVHGRKGSRLEENLDNVVSNLAELSDSTLYRAKQFGKDRVFIYS